MSATAPPPVAPPAAAPPPAPGPRRFSVPEYEQMIRAGILTENDQVELLHGRIVYKMPRNPPHDSVIARAVNRLLPPRLPAGWHCRGQSAIRLPAADSEPEPDIAVIRGEEFDFLQSHPEPPQIGLVAEVADSSLHHDRTEKLTAYAAASLPTYWIINLPDVCVEVYTDPTGPAASAEYRHQVVYGRPEDVPLVLDGREIARVPVRDLLP